MEKNKTAVDWLFHQLWEEPKDKFTWYAMLEKAKEMEKEQDRWKTVFEETPPIHTELLIKSPEGIIHLASWRESYSIFTCQCKGESNLGWQWKKI